MRILSLSILFFVVSAFAQPKEYEEYKALYTKSQEPIKVSEVPEAAVTRADIAVVDVETVLKTRFAYRRFERDGKEVLYISEVGDEKMSDEEAVRHLEACKDMFPSAKEDARTNSLLHWHGFNNTREFWKNTGQAMPLSFTLFRWANKQIVTRSDLSDPGFDYGGKRIRGSNRPGFAYWIVKNGFEAVTPQVDIEPDCQKLSPEMIWQKVTPLR